MNQNQLNLSILDAVIPTKIDTEDERRNEPHIRLSLIENSVDGDICQWLAITVSTQILKQAGFRFIQKVGVYREGNRVVLRKHRNGYVLTPRINEPTGRVCLPAGDIDPKNSGLPINIYRENLEVKDGEISFTYKPNGQDTCNKEDATPITKRVYIIRTKEEVESEILIRSYNKYIAVIIGRKILDRAGMSAGGRVDVVCNDDDRLLYITPPAGGTKGRLKLVGNTANTFVKIYVSKDFHVVPNVNNNVRINMKHVEADQDGILFQLPIE